MSDKAPRKCDADVMRELLIQLRSGANISQACKHVGIEPDNRFAWLKRKYPDFAASVNELRWGPGRTSKGGTPNAKESQFMQTAESEWGSEFNDKRIESFLLTFRESHDRDAAARASGFLPSTVMAMLDPTSEKFHAEFARAMREEEMRSLWEIEDSAWRHARVEGDATMQRFIMERRMPEYGQRAKSATDANDNKFHQDKLVEVMSSLKEVLARVRKDLAVSEGIEAAAEDIADATPN